MNGGTTTIHSSLRTRLDNDHNRELFGKPLSAHELRVLELIAEGLTNPEIGKQLYVTASTVKTQVGSMMRKLGARDRANLVALAFRRGILAVEAPQEPSQVQLARLVQRYGASGAGRRLREKLRIKQVDIARLCGVSADSVRAWEHGSMPPGSALFDYARVLDSMAKTGQLPTSIV